MKERKDRNVRGWFSFSRHKSKCRILLTPCSPPPPLHPLYSLVTRTPTLPRKRVNGVGKTKECEVGKLAGEAAAGS